ncbi:MAG: YabP/YqfC family sporulation protein [Eubacteriales bacterium]
MDENFVGLNKNNNPDLVNKTKQEIVLRNREYLKINDVTDVVSFDENGVILESGFGSISVDGAELRVTRLATGSGDRDRGNRRRRIFRSA